MTARPEDSGPPAVVLLRHRRRPPAEVVHELLAALLRRTGARRVAWIAEGDGPLESASLPHPWTGPAEPGPVPIHLPVLSDGVERGALHLTPGPRRGARSEDDRRAVEETALALGVLVRDAALSAEAVRWRTTATGAGLELDAGMGRLAAAEFAERRRLADAVTDLTDRPMREIVAGLRTAVEADSEPDRARGLDRAAEATAELSGRFRDLVRGVHPVVLREAGASAALADVAEALGVQLHVEEDGRRGGWEVETGLFWPVAAAVRTVAGWPGLQAVTARWAVVAGRRSCELHVEVTTPPSRVRVDALHDVLGEHSGRLEALGGGWSVTVADGGVKVRAHLPEDLRVTFG